MIGLVNDDILHSILKRIMQPLLNTACLVCRCAVQRCKWLTTDTTPCVFSQTDLTMIGALIIQSCSDVGLGSKAVEMSAWLQCRCKGSMMYCICTHHSKCTVGPISIGRTRNMCELRHYCEAQVCVKRRSFRTQQVNQHNFLCTASLAQKAFVAHVWRR